MSNTNTLLQKLRDIRVLRSSCSESLEGEFRVHLPEREWDEIQGLVRDILDVPKKENVKCKKCVEGNIQHTSFVGENGNTVHVNGCDRCDNGWWEEDFK